MTKSVDFAHSVVSKPTHTARSGFSRTATQVFPLSEITGVQAGGAGSEATAGAPRPDHATPRLTGWSETSGTVGKDLGAFEGVGGMTTAGTPSGMSDADATTTS